MFDKHFEVVLADSEEAKRIHYKIRYQVYCIESGYEDHRAFADGEEKDEWDHQSAHFAVRSKETGEWIAAMRLILPGNHNEQPVFRLCDIDTTVSDKTRYSKTGEISRLCIISPYRRKPLPTRSEMNLHAESSSLPHQRDRCKEPLIVLGLFRAAVQYSREHNIPYWYFLTTPALARILKRMHVNLIKAGGGCQHNGERHPFLVDLRDAVARARRGSAIIAQILGNKVGYIRYSQLLNEAGQASEPLYLQTYAA